MKSSSDNKNKANKRPSSAAILKRIRSRPQISYPKALPIASKKDEIIKTIQKHQVVVITGETGSGKTTQIPKMCLEAGRGIGGFIGCTQPRRVAAIHVAQRIAEELHEQIGRSVGYKIRFDEQMGSDPYIKVMTDGILLMEAQADPYLSAYDTIIVDEAHERNLNIDFVLGILKSILPKRKGLKVIITSATIDTQKFSQAFDHAPIIEVSGRTYPVDVRYMPVDPEQDESGEFTYIDAAVNAVGDLIKEHRRGDILIFMPTERDIRETCERFEAEIKYHDITILPLFARLSWTEQCRIFQPTSSRKIIVATNVAETSITIPGITYVIDTGLARILQYNPKTRTTGLPIKNISRSSADQRKGRCGRLQHGICLRLYSKEDYESRYLFTPPEILRTNLAGVILRMLALNIGNIASFPFIDAPQTKSIRDGIEILQELGALKEIKEVGCDTRLPILADKGRLMARFPFDPRISRMIIEAEKEGCVDEIAIIAAALSIQDPRERPAEQEAQADQMHNLFKDPSSDFMTLLRIWDSYNGVTFNTQGKMKKFCRTHFLSFKRMREWRDIYDQITRILNDLKIRRTSLRNLENAQQRYAGIHKSILSGYLSHIATKREKNIYTATKGREVMIFPGSSLYNRGGNWIVAAEVVETSRLFARTAAHIESEWMEALGGDLCRSTFSEPHWEKNREEVVAFEQVSLFGLVIVPQRRVSYGPINSDEASQIFIRSALMEGELKNPPAFLIHNQQMIQRIITMEDKIRRHHLLADEDTIAQFYAERLPGIYDTRTMQKFIRDKGEDVFLRMKEEDILIHVPDFGELAKYPDHVRLGPVQLPCSYRYEPGTPDDGLTLKVPVQLLANIPPSAPDWLVPGFLREKIAHLIKGLPKEYRKKLPPVSQTCDIIMSEIGNYKGSLLSLLGKTIYQKFGIDLSASLWPTENLPDYLKMRFVVVDSQGKPLASGREIRSLQESIRPREEMTAFQKARSAWEKEGFIDWDFGDIPESITLKDENAFQIKAYPGLEAAEGCVNFRLFKTLHEAQASHKTGVKTLYKLRFKDELAYLKKAISLPDDMKPWANELGGIKTIEKNIFEKITRDLFAQPIKSREAFIRYAQSVGPKILPYGQDVLLRIANPVLRVYFDTLKELRAHESAHRPNTLARKFLSELRSDLNCLMPPNFLEIYDNERLTHIPRYLKTLALRAERGLLHLEKAFAKTAEIKIFADQLQDVIKGLPPETSEEKKKAIEELFRMLEEYKVSLFAQELKTAFPVSKKRLEEKIREIERIN
jgi:ATP-dependent helicase HrpA